MLQSDNVTAHRALLAAATAAWLLAGCSPEPAAPPANEPPTAAAAPSPVATPPATETPFRPAAVDMKELMATVIQFNAETYWDSVSVVVDINGVTENFPETDEEWWRVRSAALTVAESGNLLLMPGRAREGAWTRFAQTLVEVGLEAAAAAEAKDPQLVFAAGEKVYDVCTACHQLYIRE